MADAAFFDTYASPYSEGATLTGLLLVTAGLLYLGRGPLGLAFGLLLCAAGGTSRCSPKSSTCCSSCRSASPSWPPARAGPGPAWPVS